MAQPFENAVMTSLGIKLLNDAQAGECNIEFTRIAVGDGTYSAEEKERSSLETMESLKNEKETKNIKIVSTVVVEKEGVHGEVGKILSVDAKKGLICAACGEGILGITALVPEGKGKMNAGDFIRGRKIDAGDVLLTPEFDKK